MIKKNVFNSRSHVLDNGNLLIEEAEVSDDGLYICQVENSVGVSEAVAKLTVHGLYLIFTWYLLVIVLFLAEETLMTSDAIHRFKCLHKQLWVSLTYNDMQQFFFCADIQAKIANQNAVPSLQFFSCQIFETVFN